MEHKLDIALIVSGVVLVLTVLLVVFLVALVVGSIVAVAVCALQRPSKALARRE